LIPVSSEYHPDDLPVQRFGETTLRTRLEVLAKRGQRLSPEQVSSIAGAHSTPESTCSTATWPWRADIAAHRRPVAR
jgi:hypothetical protein